MGYSDPEVVHNPSPTGIMPAAWADAVNAAIQWVAEDKPRCRVTRASDYTHTSSGSYVNVPFDTETRDVGGCHSTSSNTTRLTVPTGGDGDYIIGGSLAFAPSTTGRRLIRILKNASISIAQAELYVEPVGGSCSGSISAFVSLQAGDYVELGAFQASGGSLDILHFDFSPTFWFSWQGTA